LLLLLLLLLLPVLVVLAKQRRCKIHHVALALVTVIGIFLWLLDGLDSSSLNCIMNNFILQFLIPIKTIAPQCFFHFLQSIHLSIDNRNMKSEKVRPSSSGTKGELYVKAQILNMEFKNLKQQFTVKWAASKLRCR
jgi:hypothetical protein